MSEAKQQTIEPAKGMPQPASGERSGVYSHIVESPIIHTLIFFEGGKKDIAVTANTKKTTAMEYFCFIIF